MYIYTYIYLDFTLLISISYTSTRLADLVGGVGRRVRTAGSAGGLGRRARTAAAALSVAGTAAADGLGRLRRRSAVSVGCGVGLSGYYLPSNRLF